MVKLPNRDVPHLSLPGHTSPPFFPFPKAGKRAIFPFRCVLLSALYTPPLSSPIYAFDVIEICLFEGLPFYSLYRPTPPFLSFQYMIFSFCAVFTSITFLSFNHSFLIAFLFGVKLRTLLWFDSFEPSVSIAITFIDFLSLDLLWRRP